MPGVTLRGLTLGLVGFGGIAQQVANFARALGMQVLVWTRRPQAPRAEVCDVQFVPLHTLLEASDVVSVHVAHTL
jgi:D-3-phosphoglycerate dehydrogenase